MKEHRLSVLQNRVLKEEGTGDWRKFYNEDVYEVSGLLQYYIVSANKQLTTFRKYFAALKFW